jgi:hypothetical protein
MSLPGGLVNRPIVSTPHPAVIGGVWRVALRALLLLLPLLIQAGMQVPGVHWSYASGDLEKAIVNERRERRRLLAERARLLDPERLRSESRRLGLVPSSPRTDTFELRAAATVDER